MLTERLTGALPEVLVNAHTAVVNGVTLHADTRPELEARLTEWLYAELHAGLCDNNTAQAVAKRDRWLERALTEAIPHEATPVTATLREAGESLLVEWDGVLVRVPRATAVAVPGTDEPVELRVRPARPALSPGFLLTTGSRPVDLSGPALRVYVHLSDPDSAVRAWRSVLVRLESEAVAYQAKALSRVCQYPRRDALVVYLPAAHTPAAALVAAAVHGLPGVLDETSVFAERLAAGVATAWEPTDTRRGRTGLSFGQHRCLVLAQALLGAAERGEPREPAVARAFLDAGVDPDNPARNLG